LSPHGVLLAAFLKGGWNISEPLIGLFRGGGALFGLISTWLFPLVLRKMGLIKSSRFFIQFQSLMVILALLCFYSEYKLGFLVFILFSRIGLYGFSLGETQIRQEGIPEHVRGEINGFASALTSIATICLYGSGAIITSVHDFHILINLSVAVVMLSALIFTIWSLGKRSVPSF
jgi:iron-regulated transporter 1